MKIIVLFPCATTTTIIIINIKRGIVIDWMKTIVKTGNHSTKMFCSLYPTEIYKLSFVFFGNLGFYEVQCCGDMKSYIWFVDDTMKMFCLPHVFLFVLLICHNFFVNLLQSVTRSHGPLLGFDRVRLHNTGYPTCSYLNFLIQTKVKGMGTRVHQDWHNIFDNLLKKTRRP